jgi:hypothetical protein
MDERSEAIRSLSKFREMKKAQTAQRANLLRGLGSLRRTYKLIYI